MLYLMSALQYLTVLYLSQAGNEYITGLILGTVEEGAVAMPTSSFSATLSQATREK